MSGLLGILMRAAAEEMRGGNRPLGGLGRAPSTQGKDLLDLLGELLRRPALAPRARMTVRCRSLTEKETFMAIKVGDKLPAGQLYEFVEEERPGCTVGPNAFPVEEMVKGKRIAIFGVPGAFTPTCSAKHVPGYVANADKLKAKKVDEIWCVAVNDAFVMGAWGKEQGAKNKVRMMADGSAAYTKALGLEFDLVARGMGVRSQRYSMLVDDGVVKAFNLEAPGKFEVSSAEALLEQAGKLGA
jgi:peroxiredoxin